VFSVTSYHTGEHLKPVKKGNNAHIVKGSSYNEVVCLAENLYYEARGEGDIGMLAVAKVTLNRVASDKFPKTVCGVVHQKAQFSWTLSPHRVSDKVAYRRAFAIASGVYGAKDVIDVTHGSLYYHATKIDTPYWAAGFKKSTVIGNHRFYEGKTAQIRVSYMVETKQAT
jgi:spore germination cell wall hydrolase CwlJ-like protein